MTISFGTKELAKEKDGKLTIISMIMVRERLSNDLSLFEMIILIT